MTPTFPNTNTKIRMRPIVLFIYVIAFTLCSCRTTVPTETVRKAALHDTVTIVRRDTVYHTDTLRLMSYFRDTVWREESTHYVIRTVRDTFYIDKTSALSTIHHTSADSLRFSASINQQAHSDTVINRHVDTIRVRSPTYSVASSSLAQRIKELIVGFLICFVGTCLIVYINKDKS